MYAFRSCGVDMNGHLNRRDNAADRSSSGIFFLSRTLEIHGFGDHVDVFEAGTGVEEDDSIGGAEEAGREQAVIGGGGRGSLG